MVTKTFKNGIFSTSVTMGSKTPFKDLADDYDLAAANEKIVRDLVYHVEELVKFVQSLHITKTKINFDDLLPKQKLKELGF